jgi:Domain of unknown function (DUF4326)
MLRAPTRSAWWQWRRRQPPHWHSQRGPQFPWESQIRDLLGGRDLVCWCPLDQPCHADILLTLANPDRKDAA